MRGIQEAWLFSMKRQLGARAADPYDGTCATGDFRPMRRCAPIGCWCSKSTARAGTDVALRHAFSGGGVAPRRGAELGFSDGAPKRPVRDDNRELFGEKAICEYRRMRLPIADCGAAVARAKRATTWRNGKFNQQSLIVVRPD
jgi:hypothetical protein